MPPPPRESSPESCPTLPVLILKQARGLKITQSQFYERCFCLARSQNSDLASGVCWQIAPPFPANRRAARLLQTIRRMVTCLRPSMTMPPVLGLILQKSPCAQMPAQKPTQKEKKIPQDSQTSLIWLVYIIFFILRFFKEYEFCLCLKKHPRQFTKDSKQSCHNNNTAISRAAEQWKGFSLITCLLTN